MHALSPARYDSWRNLPSSGLRRWARVWVNGLYAGAHPHWGFQLLSPACLAHLWRTFASSPDGDYTKAQRQAVQTLAELFQPAWRSDPPPPSGNGRTQWERYFECLRDTDQRVFEEAIAFTKRCCYPDCPRPKWAETKVQADILASALLHRGRTRRELLTFVLNGLMSMSPPAPLLGNADLLAQMWEQKAHLTAYTVITELRWLKPLSRTSLREQLSPITVWSDLLSPLQLDQIIFCILADNARTFAVSRHIAQHPESCVDAHRHATLERLRQRAKTAANISLSSATHLQRADCLGAEPLLESKDSSEEIRDSLIRTTGEAPDAYLEKSLGLFRDFPEQAIELLCNRCEHLFHTQWPVALSRAYRSSLLSAARRHLVGHLLQLAHTWDNTQIVVPEWIRYLIYTRAAPKQDIGFEEVGKRMRADEISQDDLVAATLAQLADGSLHHCAYIYSTLMITRGLRNKMTHYPSQVTEFPLYLRQRLFLVLAHAYAAAIRGSRAR
jgi:hypothetical protein